MNKRAWTQVGILTAILLTGLLVGWLAARFVWPATCARAWPNELNTDSQCRWAAAVALAYRYDHDLARAQERLLALGADGLGALCPVMANDCSGCLPGVAEAANRLLSDLGVACPSQAGK